MHAIRADLSNVGWRKSTYSNGHEDCLEVADNIPGGVVPVRDSKNPSDSALVFPAGSWYTFVEHLASTDGVGLMRADLSNATWRKSTYSSGQEDCLEIADNMPGGVVPVRDSKNPAGPALLFTAGAWSRFVEHLAPAAAS
ncbi:DUF397 domain-containing protein [Streptomyces triculaminicus]|uniref:DUF397 domain-containing protein n=1 Tax=Streptomyces triculaminicus TaxID=2816232 RepID=UPI0037D25218